VLGGISLSAAKALQVENCRINNFVTTSDGVPGFGIQVQGGFLIVMDAVLDNNSNGIDFSGGANIRGLVENCRIAGNEDPNGIGLQIGAAAHVTVSESVLSGHDTAIYLRGLTGSPIPLLTLSNCVITHNRIGLYADRNGQVHLSGSTITLNDTGVSTLNGGVVYTSGNNSIIGNLTNNYTGSNIIFFKSDVTV
jgi:hypothetical protein